MRGGRGGRGRGGFGRGGSSFIQSFLRDSGDYRNVNDPEDAPPPLYPPITLPAPVELNEEDKFLLQMNSEIIKRFQHSPYFLKRKSDDGDLIVRYSDKNSRAEQDSNLYEYIVTDNDKSSECPLPRELLVDIKNSKVNKSIKKSVISSADKKSDEDMKTIFDRLESSEKGASNDINKPKQDGDSDSEVGEEAEVQDDGDYGRYYDASDNEGDDDAGENDAVYD